MRQLPIKLVVLTSTVFMVSHSLNSADHKPAREGIVVDASSQLQGREIEKVQYEAGRDPTLESVDDDAIVNNKDPQAEIATMAGGSLNIPVGDDEFPRDQEQVWGEISQAISGLNDMVGDEMFRDLRRTEGNRMEVRVDAHFWQRVRYETRVDLKNDISNIWHLYVLQYVNDDSSSVYFIDDKTNKTIDIFSKYR